MTKPIFSDAARTIQERFETRALADRMADLIFHEALSDEDKAFVENAMFFFLASVDANGQPQCSYKGGPRGFIRVTGPSELSFPLYEGNGLYASAGNMAETGKIGMLFIDFENQTRMRVNGVAQIDDAHPMLGEVAAAQMIVRVKITDIHPNCPRNVHKMTLDEASEYSPKSEGEDVGKAPWGEYFDDVLPEYMKPDDLKGSGRS
jgi:hypothetical protein